MRHRFFVGTLTASAAVVLCLGASTAGQARGSKPAPRTPWGAPDLQGTWTGSTLTPLERPRSLADRPFFTEEEARALEAQAAGRQAAADDPQAREQALARGDIGSYNQF